MKSLILFDTEYTAWKGSQKRNWSNDNEHREIIQISAYKIKNYKLIDKLNIYVKPNINKKHSKYITDLTGITNNKINKYGISFKKAIEKFYEFSKFYNLYSYGNDRSFIKENLNLNNIKDPKWHNLKNKCFDFKNYIKKNTKINPNKYSSGTIFKAFNINVNIDTHNALDDVKSMYFVFLKINNKNF